MPEPVLRCGTLPMTSEDDGTHMLVSDPSERTMYEAAQIAADLRATYEASRPRVRRRRQ